MAQEGEQDDAARAFEDLAAEVRVMRRAVEALEAKKPTDYAPTLAELTQGLERLTGATAAMARRPAVALTPEAYAAQLRHAQDDAVRAVSTELQRAQTLTGQLDRSLGGIRTREEQRSQVLRAAGGALAIGAALCLFLLPPIARALPTSWHVPEKLAAGVVGENRWTAGQRMMTSYAPGAWENIARGAELASGNREALERCQKDAARAGKSRRCTIEVGAPASLSLVPKAGAAS